MVRRYEQWENEQGMLRGLRLHGITYKLLGCMGDRIEKWSCLVMVAGGKR